MSKLKLDSKSQSFDLEKDKSDYIEVFKVLYATPRLYKDLYNALCQKIPSFKRIMLKLVEQGFVAFQEDIIFNTITGAQAQKASKPVTRFILTREGKKKLQKYVEDPAFFDIDFKKVDASQRNKVVKILTFLDLQPPHSRYGLSVNHLLDLVDFNSRTLRWWLELLVSKNFIQVLPEKFGDVRVVVPAHFRVSRELSRQLETAVNAIGGERNLVLLKTLKLKRSKYLNDIKVARVGINGATDYEHDVDTQVILAKFVLSGSLALSNIFDIEPRITLKAFKNTSGDYVFTENGTSAVFYQPDALFKESQLTGSFAYSFLEYERFQTRKDGWEHIEKFIGFMSQKTLPFEQGILRFVVDGKNRQRVYVKLIEAFTDSVLDNYSLLPKNPLTIKVSTMQAVLNSSNAIKDDIWYSIDLPSGQSESPQPKLHSGSNPYSDYFARGRQW